MKTFTLTGGPLGGEQVDAKGWTEGDVRWFDQPADDAGNTPLARVGYRNDPGEHCMFIGEEAKHN